MLVHHDDDTSAKSVDPSEYQRATVEEDDEEEIITPPPGYSNLPEVSERPNSAQSQINDERPHSAQSQVTDNGLPERPLMKSNVRWFEQGTNFAFTGGDNAFEVWPIGESTNATLVGYPDHGGHMDPRTAFIFPSGDSSAGFEEVHRFWQGGETEGDFKKTHGSAFSLEEGCTLPSVTGRQKYYAPSYVDYGFDEKGRPPTTESNDP